MKRFASVAVAALVACSFALTGINVHAATHSNASTTPPKLHKGVTLTVWDYFCTTSQTTCPERDAEVKVIKKWEKLTGDHVSFPTNPDNHVQKMCTAGPAGQAADVVSGPHDQIAVDVACGVVAPVPAWAWTPAQQKGYIGAALQATTLSGKKYAMPWAIETTGLWYNKSLIKSSAFKAAKGKKYLTWAQLIPKLKAATPSGGLPFAWDQTNFYYDYAFIAGGGGYVFKFTKKGYDYKKLGLATPGAIKGLQFILDLTDHGKYKLYPDSMTYSAGKALFEQGKVPAFFTGPWDRADFETNHVNIGFVPLPSFDGKKPLQPFSGVQTYYLNKYGHHVNEAASLMSYLSKNLAGAEYAVSGRIPVTKSVINSKKVQSDPINGGLAHAALAAVPIPNIPEMGQVWAPMASSIALIVKGQASPSAAANAAVAQIAAAITKAHGG